MSHSDRRWRAGVGLGLAVAALASALATEARAQTAPARPEFRVLRFEEDWSLLRGRESLGGLDRLKFLPLTRISTWVSR